MRLPSVSFSLHQSGEKQGFLLDEIAITASVVTIMGTSGYPPRESGRDDFTPRLHRRRPEGSVRSC
jgi:hypothetical protein